jgi:hypothetical protein
VDLSRSVGANLLGFTLWHIPACQDWTVHSWIQNVPEVREREPWTQAIGLDRLGVAFGISLEAADGIARGVTVTDVLACADVVLAESKSWLSTLREADPDRVPDNRAHLARHPPYRTAAYLADVDNMWTHTRGRHLPGHRARTRSSRRSPARGRARASHLRPMMAGSTDASTALTLTSMQPRPSVAMKHQRYVPRRVVILW